MQYYSDRRERQGTPPRMSSEVARGLPRQVPCVGYDLTISVEASTPGHTEVAAVLSQVFKKWAFQRERGEGGYDHWQVRGHLFSKKRQAECVSQYGQLVWAGHWSPTSSAVHAKNCFNYVMKADSRVDGPWTSQDPEFEDAPVLTRQLRTYYAYEPYEWQATVKELAQRLDDRLIRCIIDHQGNIGKSIFCEALEYEKLAYEIPPMTCMEDIMQCCMCLKPQKCYLIDMPRAMKKDKLASFYAGIEALKNGTMYDKRHSFKKRRIDRPAIVVFTNVMPDLDLLSKDRWDLYETTPGYGLRKLAI